MSTSASSDRTASTDTRPPGGAPEWLVVVHQTYVSHHAAHCAGGLTAGAHVLGPFADGPGRVIPEPDVRVAHEAGQPVGAGTVGEILVRGREHGLVSTDYYGMPEATAAAFHDGWFRTGGLGRLDRDGHLCFVSRNTEVIRRRGENAVRVLPHVSFSVRPDV